MATLAEIRAQYPQYGDMSDQQLADAFYAKYYSDIPQADFYQKVGLTPQAPQPTESGGFLGSGLSALKERVTTAWPAAKLYTGLGDQQTATDELAKHKADANNAFKETEFSEIGDALKNGDPFGALGKTIDKFKEVAGSSLGSMAPAMGAGAGAGLWASSAAAASAAAAAAAGVAAAPPLLSAAAVGTIAFGLTALGSYLFDNISRQKEEQAKAGDKYADINRLSATAAAAGQTALDIFGFRFFKPLGRLVGIEGKEAADTIAAEIIQAATRPKAYARAVAKGTAEGVAFEVPQEVTQQVLERWQAGLAINPFADPEAAKEYLEAAGGALLLGGPMGAYSKARETRAARVSPEGQATLRKETSGWIQRDLEGVPDATESVGSTTGAGAGVAGQPDTGPSTEGTGTTERGGVAPAQQNVAGAPMGEGTQPGALEGETNVVETAETKQAEAQKQEAAAVPVTPADVQSTLLTNFAIFSDQYTQLRNNAIALDDAAKPGDRKANKAAKEAVEKLQNFVNRYAPNIFKYTNDPEATRKLKSLVGNPKEVLDTVYTALESKSVSQPRAMQGGIEGGKPRAATVSFKDGRGVAGNESVLIGLREITEDDDIALEAPKRAGAVMLTTVNRQHDGKKGRASAALRAVTDWADTNGKPLVLMPSASGDLDTPGLKAWYARNGFVEKADGAMERVPYSATTQGELYAAATRAELEKKQQQRELKRMTSDEARTRLEAQGIENITPNMIASLMSQTLEAEKANRERNQSRKNTSVAPVSPQEGLLGAEVEQPAPTTPTGKLQTKTARQQAQEQAPAAKTERGKGWEQGKRRPSVDWTQEATEETKVAEPAAPAVSQKETVVAPLVSTEHVEQTEEGKQIRSFLDALAPISTSADEQTKHGAAKGVAQEALLSYDIVKPGETTSPGMQAVLGYLHDLVGGKEQFDKLVANLKGRDPATQAEMLRAVGLPGLNTRRGMETFASKVQAEVERLPIKNAAAIPIAPKAAAAPATGEAKGTMPYESEARSQRMTTAEHGATEAGKPRRPSTSVEEKGYKIQDNKLRAAWRHIKQLIQTRGTPSVEALAAKNYMENPARETFGDVLNDLAYDIANEQAAHTTFYGEGGEYAQRFQKWINENLDQSTVDTLNNLISDYTQNRAEIAKYDTAVTKYNALLETYVEKRRADAEKAAGVKIPKTPKVKHISERITESDTTETTPDATVSRKNLPRVQLLIEVHPAIRRMLEAGDTQGALKAMADVQNNPYYAALARRLLDTNITAESKVISGNEIMSLSNDPKVRESLDSQLDSLREMVKTSLPEELRTSMTDGLRSKRLQDVKNAVIELQSTFTNESQKEVAAQTLQLLNDQFSWVGKYDPASDKMYLRQGSLTNHLFLHEALHAATLDLLDNADKLQGARRQAYERLEELYNHSKGILSLKGLSESNTYGLQDLHEFVSEAMTNPEFQVLLRAIRYKSAPFSLMNVFTSAIRGLFGIKPGRETNIMVEVMESTNILMIGGSSAALEKVSGKSEPKAMAAAKQKRRISAVPPGLRNTPTTMQHLMKSKSWDEVKSALPIMFNSGKAGTRPAMLGMLTLRQMADLVNNRIPQVSNFIRVTEEFLARKNGILQESGNISKAWEHLQSSDPEVSRGLARVMHSATILEMDPDRPTAEQQKNKKTPAQAELLEKWRVLPPAAKRIYRQVRDFYERRFAEYQKVMDARLGEMLRLGVSEATILVIRKEFESNRRTGPYFPLMRHGRFWYQIGKGPSREYYMFETAGQKELHMKERVARNPELPIKEGSTYAEQMDFHTKQSTFLKAAFEAIDDANFKIPGEKQNLKDSIYQTYLANQPEQSFRRQFLHRSNVAGYSEDALRNFAGSSFHMAYQLARFEHSSDMFSQVQDARMQVKGRFDAANDKHDVALSRENNELSDYVTEMEKRLNLMLNPTDIGTIPSVLSNIGFIWYLTAPASAIVNVLGGMVIGLPTLVGQNVRMNPGKSYTKAILESLGQMKSVAGQIIATGFDVETGARARDTRVLFPTLSRSSSLSALDKKAYERFAADGLIDITAAYDQSGLAASPTDSYGGIRNRTMEALTSLFHNAERFNREVVAMSAFRAAMEKRKGYTDQEVAFAESVADAKDMTQRSMFDYSSANKPRFFQHPVARVVLQFKQFPQQMTFFLAHNAVNMFKGMDEATRREARARFVGTMGMAGIFSGVTGLWGFSTVASILNAVMNGLKDEDDEEPFDFELEFVNWAVETFGLNMGTMLTRGMGNAMGTDIASRVKLDDMWFRDSRKNQDEVQALQSHLIDLLGPTVGLAINAAEAAKLYNEGHADRALETVMPAFIKHPMVAARYANEGVNTLGGDPLIEEVGPFDLMMQSIGLRSSKLSELQYYNATVKGQEQTVLKERQNLLNLYALAFMSNDSATLDKVYDKIDKFNTKHMSVNIPADALTKAITGHLKKSSQMEHGLYIDKRLMGVLDRHAYIQKYQ